MLIRVSARRTDHLVGFVVLRLILSYCVKIFWHFCVTFDVTMMMAGKNQAALAVCAQTKVIFAFKQTFQMRGVVFLFVLILFAVIAAVAASFRAVILLLLLALTAILLTRLPASLLAWFIETHEVLSVPGPRGQHSGGGGEGRIRFIEKPCYKTKGVAMWLNVVPTPG